MGHLFEKRKICHGFQGNYRSEEKKSRGGKEEEEEAVGQILWTELDFGGILSLQDKQRQPFSWFYVAFIHPSSCHPRLLSSSLSFVDDVCDLHVSRAAESSEKSV